MSKSGIARWEGNVARMGKKEISVYICGGKARRRKTARKTEMWG
jgi:hypothetical protein